MSSTKSIKQVQEEIIALMAEMDKSDFRQHTVGDDIDYGRAYESLRAAHVYLEFQKNTTPPNQEDRKQ